MKKIIVFIFSLIILSGCTKKLSAVTNNDIKIFLDGNEILFEENFPYIDDNKVLQFPLDSVSDIFHMNVTWDNDRLTAFIINDNKKISLRIGDNNLILNGKSLPMSSIVYKIDGKVFIPLQSVLNVFEYETKWDYENKTFEIKTPPDKTQIGSNTFNFACNLANQLEHDYFFSPLSIKLGLTMLANGSDDETKKQITDALKIENLDEYNHYVENYLSKIKNNDEVELNLGNSIWVNEDTLNDVALKKDFVSAIDNYFYGTISKVNNQNAVEIINNWISEKTNNKIKNAVDSPDFLLSLINTIYFSQQWELPFNPKNNLQDNFTCADGSKIITDFMSKKDYYNYFENDAYKMISLPLKNSDLSMYIVLPKSNDFSLNQIVFDNLEEKHVDVKIPIFKREFTMEDNLKKLLIDLGMKNIFSGFSSNNMLENYDSDILCDKIVHKSFIDLNEYGVEAAASTLIMINKMSLPVSDEIVEFYADKPFKYFIRDNSNGEILFLGDFSSIQNG